MSDELSVNPSGEAPCRSSRCGPHGPRWVFFGSDGLRAGWSALLFVAIVVGLGRILTLVVRAIHHGHRPDPNAPASP